MELTEETVDGVRVCRLAGSLGMEASDELRSELHKIAESGADAAVLNLEGVTFLCSSSLGALVSFRQAVTRAGGKIALCGLSTTIHKLFKISRLDEFFNIAASESAAIAAVGA